MHLYEIKTNMPKKFKKLLVTFLIVSILTTLIASFAIAQDETAGEETEKKIEMEIDYPKTFGSDPTKSVPDYIKYIYQFSAGLAGFLAVLMITLGGISLMTSAGDPRRMSDAKDQILKALMGLGLVLGSFAIISIINPDLLLLKEPQVEDMEEDNWSLGKTEDYGVQKVGMLGDNTSSTEGTPVLYDSENYDATKVCSSLARTGPERTMMTDEELTAAGQKADENSVYCVFYNPDNGEILKGGVIKLYTKKKGDNDCITDPKSSIMNCYDASKLSDNVKSCTKKRKGQIFCFAPQSSTSSNNPSNTSPGDDAVNNPGDTQEGPALCKCKSQDPKGTKGGKFTCVDAQGKDLFPDRNRKCGTKALCYWNTVYDKSKIYPCYYPDEKAKCTCLSPGSKGGTYTCWSSRKIHGTLDLEIVRDDVGTCPQDKTCYGTTIWPNEPCK